MSKARMVRLLSVGFMFCGGLACGRQPDPPAPPDLQSPAPPGAIPGMLGGSETSGMGKPADGQGSQAAAVLREATKQPESVSADLQLLIALVAEWRDLPAGKIAPSQTFAELGCDELDVTEITMEAEKRLKIKIPNAAVQAAAARATVPRDSPPFEWRGLHLTLAQFADVMTAARTR